MIHEGEMQIQNFEPIYDFAHTFMMPNLSSIILQYVNKRPYILLFIVFETLNIAIWWSRIFQYPILA